MLPATDSQRRQLYKKRILCRKAELFVRQTNQIPLFPTCQQNQKKNMKEKEPDNSLIDQHDRTTTTVLRDASFFNILFFLNVVR